MHTLAAVPGSSTRWPAVYVTAAFYSTTTPERSAFQRVFQCLLYSWTFPVGLGANYYTYSMNKGGGVLSVGGFKFVSLLVDSSGKSSLTAQPMTLRHNTGAAQWKRETMRGGGERIITITPTFVAQIKQPQWCSIAQWAPALFSTVWK